MEFLKILEGIRTSFLDNLFYILTYGGEELMLLGFVGILFWCVDKKTAYRIVFSYLPSILIINTLKITFKVERPWVRDPSLTIVEKARASATGYSFPSGHTQCAVSLWGTLAVKARQIWKKILCFAIIAVVMFSRMYLGVHTPADVLTSFVISVVVVIFVNMLIDRIEITKKHRLIIMIFLITLGVFYVIYTLILLKYGHVSYSDAADGCKGAAAGIAFAASWYAESVYIRFDPKCKNIWLQILKVAMGLGGVMIIRSGIKALFDSNILIDMIRYFLMMSWAMLAMPLLIRRFFAASEETGRPE